MSFAKLRILLWKNWILQRRRPFSGILQIVFPILIVVVTAWMKNSLQNNYNFYGNRFEGEFSLANFSICNRTLERVLYYPTNEAYDKLIQDSFNNIEVELRGFNTSSDLSTEFWRNEDEIQMTAIEFSSESLVSFNCLKLIFFTAMKLIRIFRVCS